MDVLNVPEQAGYPKFCGEGRVEVVERDVPKPQQGQLLIACRANAVCASDLHGFERGAQVSPGHEAAGIVVATGPDTHVAVGSHGVIFLMDFCGQCRSCLHGITNQCLDKRADYGFSHDGGYGPYMIVNENVFFQIDDDIPFAEATILLDIMGTGGHALKRAASVHPDIQSVLVTGSGPIGLGVIAMARLVLGPDVPIVATDLVPYRLDMARKLGALTVDVSKESLTDGLKRHGLESVDIAIDSSGKTVARRAALDALAKRGALICVGHGEGLQLDISPDLIATERAILGSEYFRYDEMPGNLKIMRENLPYLSQIITHRFPVAEIETAFQTFIKGNTGKVIVEQ